MTDDEPGPGSALARHTHESAVLLHHSIDGGKAQPGALLPLGSEKRLEEMAASVAVDAAARIDHAYHRVASGSVRARGLWREVQVGGLDGHQSTRRHRVARVQDQVQDDLLHLTGVG